MVSVSVVRFDSQILDGRNRYRACIEAGVEPSFETYNGDDPLAYVISLNLNRRHLDESQRAMVAAKIATLPKGANQHVQICAPTQEEASDMLNVGRRSVQHARAVLDEGAQELTAAVERGEVSVSAAAAVARLPEPDQQEIVEAGTKAVVEAASAIRKDGVEQFRLRSSMPKFTGDFEWYTPTEYIELAVEVMGAIDCDPASCADANRIVGAKVFYSQDDDGLKQDWHGRVG